MNHTSLVCVCKSRRDVSGTHPPADTKTARRRCVCTNTHGAQHFLSLLLGRSSSSVSKRLVILHAVVAWLYDCELDNDRGGVGADE